MENQIKIRAWDPEKKRMIKHNIQALIFSHKGLVVEYHRPPLEAHLKLYGGVVMLYTGLKDKSGVEIYMDDILSYDIKGEPRKARVYQIAGGFMIKAAYWSESVKELTPSDELIAEPLADPQVRSFIQTQCLVIGNKYQNLELIESKI